MFTFPVGFFRQGIIAVDANTANLNGTNHYFNNTSYPGSSLNSGVTVFGFINHDTFNDGYMVDIGTSLTDPGSGFTIRATVGGVLQGAILGFGTFEGTLVLGSGWNFFAVSVDGTSIILTVNGTSETISMSETLTIIASTEFVVGGRRVTHTVNTDAKFGFVGVSSSVLSTPDRTTLYNMGIALCYDLLPESIQTNLVSYYDLSNWPGHTSQETTDQTGNGHTLTNNNSVPFNGSGLQVECAG